MVNKKIRVLQVNASSKFGGVSAVILNYYRHMDHKKVAMDFLSPDLSSFELFREEIQSNGDHVYFLKSGSRGLLRYVKFALRLNKFVKKQTYDIVHINTGVLKYNFLISFICKHRNIKNIIVHSHSSIQYKGLKKKIASMLKKLLDKNCDYFFACSKKAAESMFTEKRLNNGAYQLISNAIDVEKYGFNLKLREKIRFSLKLEEDTIVVGNVARFVDVKNHKFMIEVLKQIDNDYPNVNIKLLLIGSGPNEEEIKKLVENYQLTKKVIFLGMKENVEDYYNAMDFFILPSFYEGLPVVGIEAQCNGIRCLFSANITREVDVTQKSFFLGIDEKYITKWVNILIDKNNQISLKDRKCSASLVTDNNYNINRESEKLVELYNQMIK